MGQQVGLLYTPYGGYASELDVDVFTIRGAGDVDEVELFPDLLHRFLDGSLAREIAGGRRNFDLSLDVMTDPVSQRKLVQWFLDQNAQLKCLATTPGSVTVTATTGGSLTASSDYYYEIRSIDAIGGGITTALGSSDAATSLKKSMTVSWSSIPNSRLYAVYRKKDTGHWFLHDYSLTNSYLDDGSKTSYLDLGVSSPPSSASVISFVQETTKLVAEYLDGFRGAKRYSFRLNEAALMPNNTFPV